MQGCTDPPTLYPHTHSQPPTHSPSSLSTTASTPLRRRLLASTATGMPPPPQHTTMTPACSAQRASGAETLVSSACSGCCLTFAAARHNRPSPLTPAPHPPAAALGQPATPQCLAAAGKLQPGGKCRRLAPQTTPALLPAAQPPALAADGGWHQIGQPGRWHIVRLQAQRWCSAAAPTSLYWACPPLWGLPARSPPGCSAAPLAWWDAGRRGLLGPQPPGSTAPPPGAEAGRFPAPAPG